jgi:hypothetical protein
MNKSLLSIGIILSLGSVGCAGLGVQQNSSLAGQYRAERGLDELWSAEQAPPQGAETPLYSEQSLGDLWEAPTDDLDGVADPGYDAERGGDLWNPASVTRSWEPHAEQGRDAYRLSQSQGGLWY